MTDASTFAWQPVARPLAVARMADWLPNLLQPDPDVGHYYAGLLVDAPPGIWTPEQVAGCRLATKVVHDKGGHIYLQLWHVGRVSHPDLQPGHQLPVAPSAVRAEGLQAYTYEGFKPLVTPRAPETKEIAGIVATTHTPPNAPRMLASTVSRSTPPTATCCCSSCPTRPTSAPTGTAAPSRTARASWWRSSMR